MYYGARCRGVDLDQLLDMTSDQLMDLFHARVRRRFQRGLKRKPLALVKRLRKAKKVREGAQGEENEGCTAPYTACRAPQRTSRLAEQRQMLENTHAMTFVAVMRQVAQQRSRALLSGPAFARPVLVVGAGRHVSD